LKGKWTGVLTARRREFILRKFKFLLKTCREKKQVLEQLVIFCCGEICET